MFSIILFWYYYVAYFLLFGISFDLDILKICCGGVGARAAAWLTPSLPLRI